MLPLDVAVLCASSPVFQVFVDVFLIIFVVNFYFFFLNFLCCLKYIKERANTFDMKRFTLVSLAQITQVSDDDDDEDDDELSEIELLFKK